MNKNAWFSTNFKHQLVDVTTTFYDLWKEMIVDGRKELLCIGPDGAGRLKLTSDELFETINFLETIKELEEIR